MYEEILLDAEEKMEKALEHLIHSFRGVRTGRASPGLVEDIRVDYYGSISPLKHAASISIPEPRLIVIKPFDAGLVNEVVKAIHKKIPWLAKNVHRGFNRWRFEPSVQRLAPLHPGAIKFYKEMGKM